MRIRIIGQLLAAVLLLGGMLVTPVLDLPVTHVVADEGKDESGQNEKDDKDEKKDDKEKEDDKDKHKDKDKDEDKDKDDDDRGGAAITGGENYMVDVECEYDEESGTTTCTFTGVAPEGGKDVSHVDLPEDEVCAEVVDGDYEYVDPDPNTRVTGYKSRGSEGTFTLVLDGEVVVEGTATYWFKTGDGVFPATGPGLTCGETTTQAQTASDSTEATAEPTAAFELQTTPGSQVTPGAEETSGETGELLVDIYTCTDVPDDTTGYDWFGMCDPEGGVHQFELAPVSEVAVEPQTAESDASGDVTFADLEPGMYRLVMTDVSWCKAVSDNVDAESNVIIEAGQRTTVYGFVCDGKPAS